MTSAPLAAGGGRAGTALSPFAFAASGWRNRRLILRLARRKIEERYRGSLLGFLWALIQPLLMLCVYTFVFSVLFEARWGAIPGGRAEFALFLFSGMLLFAIFAECVNEAPGLMIAYRSTIKQVLFPVEILPWVSLLAALFHFLVGAIILLGFHGVIRGAPPISILALPFVMLPLLLLTLGATWLLSSLGVYLRDISQLVGVLTTALFFLSPIFYPLSRVPEAIRPYYELNPFVPVLEMSKGSIFAGALPDWSVLAALTLGAWAAAWLGWVFFTKARKGFADVL